MIFKLYSQLKETAISEYGDIVEHAEIIFNHYGRVKKLRLKLIDTTLIDIWYSVEGSYSFHWEQSNIRNTIYRHDNAPHKRWSYIKTFPKHCHVDTQDNVTESNLPDNPESALKMFLETVKNKIIKLKHKE